MKEKSMTIWLMAVLVLCFISPKAEASDEESNANTSGIITIGFEDLGPGQHAVPTHYAGLTWDSHWDYYSWLQWPLDPESSGPVRIIYGSWIDFGEDVTFLGSWVGTFAWGGDKYWLGYDDGELVYESEHMIADEKKAGWISVCWPNVDYVVFSGAHGSYAVDDISYIREPSTPPPVANADGPYTINVGDTLILNGSASSDPEGEIVSYMWDLDDDGSFETDADGQAIFDVNYAYLDSLGLLGNNTYTIHLRVTDDECQSDTNETTLTILAPPAIAVSLDIKPGSCPNPLNVKRKGALPVAILGTEDFDVNSIDIASIELAGVGPIRSSVEDVETPVQDGNECECNSVGPDGHMDLMLKFETEEVVEAVGEVNAGDVVSLVLTGVLDDETPIEGTDCVWIVGRFKPFNKADMDKDGVVSMTDFAIFADNWLQSTIIEE